MTDHCPECGSDLLIRPGIERCQNPWHWDVAKSVESPAPQPKPPDLLEQSRTHVMSDAEKQAQREIWGHEEMAMEGVAQASLASAQQSPDYEQARRILGEVLRSEFEHTRVLIIMNAVATAVAKSKQAKECRNPNHALVDGKPFPHEIGSSCIADQPASLSERSILKLRCLHDIVGLIERVSEDAASLSDEEIAPSSALKWLRDNKGISNPIILDYGKSLHDMPKGTDCVTFMAEFATAAIRDATAARDARIAELLEAQPCKSPDSELCDNENNHPYHCHCNDPLYEKRRADSALSRLDDVARTLTWEKSDDGTCSRCGEFMAIREGDDPTEICDHCAQEIVAALLSRIAPAAGKVTP
jgi:hypothetical protein